MKITAPSLNALLVAVFACGAFCGGPPVALAEGSSLSPFEAPVTSAASFNAAISDSLSETSQVTVINPVDVITFTTQVQTLGNVTFRFNREWHVPDVSFSDNGFSSERMPRDGVHLQGYAELRASENGGIREKKQVPAAATIFNVQSSSPLIQVTFLAGTADESSHYYQVRGSLKGQSTPRALKVRRLSRQAFSNKTCGVSANGKPLEVQEIKKSPLFVAPSVKSAASFLSFDLATEADFEWFSRYGSGSNTKIQSILNQVQSLYQDQLNLTFNLTKQVVLSTSGRRYNSSNVDTLLTSFRDFTDTNRHLGSADLYHLFTGKDTFLIDEDGNSNSSVIGLAYLGVVCAFPTFSYGLTEDLDDALNHITTAHEIGHNFRAEHDVPGSIMGTTLNLNNPPTTFSTSSKSQIGSWVSNNSSCLTASDGTPGGGGSGSAPGEGDTSHIALSVSLKRNGNFTLSTTFSEIEAGCSATVRAASTAGGAYAGTVLATLNTDVLSSTYRNVKFPRKVGQFVGSTRRVQKVYIGVTKECPSATYYSVTKSVSPFKVNSDKPALKVGSWIKSLARKVQATTPQ